MFSEKKMISPHMTRPIELRKLKPTVNTDLPRDFCCSNDRGFAIEKPTFAPSMVMAFPTPMLGLYGSFMKIFAKSELAVLGVLILAISLTSTAQGAEKDDPEAIAFFEKNIRPILIDQCYKCHSVESGKSKGGLLLDSKSGLIKGGDTGPSVVPGNTEKSLLLTAISHSDPDLEMPPKKTKLSEKIISDFRTWIEKGAADPRKSTGTIANKPPVSVEEGRDFWSFKKLVRAKTPLVKDKDWPRRDLDYFILAALEKRNLAPSTDATPSVILRRLHFDLVGLPPSPQAMDSFLKTIAEKDLDTALEAQVDSLMASDRYGERWGRHWMDAARFAESSGKESNLTFPHAWRYRDYVIDSFNDDTPFDRFIEEQIAGDLLPYDNDQERAEHLIATGFLAFGPKSLNEANKLQFSADLIDEQIDVISRAFMANSIACARCHDHKFDPYSMTDYYALAGIFASTETFFGTAIDSENNVGGDLITLPPIKDQLIPNKSFPKNKFEALKNQLATLNEEERTKKSAFQRAVKEGTDPREIYTLRDVLRIMWSRGRIEGQLETVDTQGNALPLTMGTLDRKTIINVPLLNRGSISTPGDEVLRGFPEVIQLENIEPPSSEQSGRLELARWLAHPDHPLTSRVMVNRAWRWMIGNGIVRTTDNFGFNGESPSHPELLDHLALHFVENGWSIKELVKEIALSRTYRQSSDWNKSRFLEDAGNRLVWRANKRRMDAECIRDAMLVVSGDMDFSRRPGSLIADKGNQSVSLFGFSKDIPSDLDGCRYRSVYLPVIRNRLPDALGLFDFAEPGLVTGSREVTNVAPQSLYLLNSPFVRERAESFARRVLHKSPDPIQQFNYAFQLCFNRPPDEEENRTGLDFISQIRTLKDVKTSDSEEADHLKVLTNYCQALLSAAEFRNLD
jgi:hypothetical protein